MIQIEQHGSRLRRAILVLGMIVLGTEAPRAQDEQAQDQENRSNLMERATLTGDWGGLRDQLARYGIDVGLTLLVDGSYPVVGGLRTRDTWQHRLDLTMSFDPEPLFGWKNARFGLVAYNKAGRPASFDIGDIQVVSNMDAPEETRLHEWFWSQRLPWDWMSFRLGLLDSSRTFDVIESGTEFMNSSAGATPTFFDFPYYPQSAPGIELTLEFVPSLLLRLALYDTTDIQGLGPGLRPRRGLFRSFGVQDSLYIAEVDFREHFWNRQLRAFGGVWAQSGNYFDLSGNETQGGQGFYGTVEAGLLPADSRTQLVTFIAYSVGDPEVSGLIHHFMIGSRLSDFWVMRPRDSLGLMFSRALPNGRLKTIIPEPESTTEFYYRMQVTPWFAAQPDFQYIHHPGGQSNRRDVFVTMLRLELIF